MAALEVLAVPAAHLTEERLVALEVGDLEVLEAVPDLLEALDLGVGALAHLAICLSAESRAFFFSAALAPSASSSAEVVLEVLAIAAMSESRLIDQRLGSWSMLGLQVRQVLVAAVLSTDVIM